MLCYAACPVYGLEPNFLGPAAIALGYRYNMDSRDQGKDQRAVIGNHDGIWDCTFVGECSVVCPKDVDPAAAIQRSKVDTTKSWFQSSAIVLPLRMGEREMPRNLFVALNVGALAVASLVVLVLFLALQG